MNTSTALTSCPPPLLLPWHEKCKFFDYVLIPDVIEHLADPLGFLTGLRKHYGDSFQKVLLSVPNAFWVMNFRNATKQVEIVNTDHYLWFSPYTVVKYLYNSGLISHNYNSKTTTGRGNVTMKSIVNFLYDWQSICGIEQYHIAILNFEVL